MKDNEIRGIILQWFYEHRKEGKITPKQEDFNSSIQGNDISRICKQLNEYKLINWEGIYKFDKWSQPPKLILMHGEISAKGIDVIEKEGHPSPIGITFTQNISVNQSQGVQIGSNNIQTFDYSIGQLILQIDRSQATDEEKREAKSKLKLLLENPLIASIIGAGITALIARM
jgi:hypothetical protein